MADTTPIYLDEFKAMHPADLADRLQRMPTEEARHLLAELPVDTASATLAELEDEWIADLLEEFPSPSSFRSSTKCTRKRLRTCWEKSQRSTAHACSARWARRKRRLRAIS